MLDAAANGRFAIQSDLRSLMPADFPGLFIGGQAAAVSEPSRGEQQAAIRLELGR